MKILLHSAHKALAIFVCGVVSLATLAAVNAQEGWGTLKGQVVVGGDAPDMPVEKVGDHPDRPVCLVDGELPKDDNIVVGENGGLRDVFVMMYTKGKGENAPVHESYDADDGAGKQVSIDNVNCRFVPHAVFVRTGQSVVLKNSDSVGHNCHITTFNNEHNVALPAGGDVKIKFEQTDKFPGQVKCDMHSWMDAVLLVRDNPYVAITDSEGKFEIKNVPAGEWEFQFWHSKAGYMKKLESGDYKFGRKGQADVSVANESETDMGKLEFPVKAFK